MHNAKTSYTIARQQILLHPNFNQVGYQKACHWWKPTYRGFKKFLIHLNFDLEKRIPDPPTDGNFCFRTASSWFFLVLSLTAWLVLLDLMALVDSSKSFLWAARVTSMSSWSLFSRAFGDRLAVVVAVEVSRCWNEQIIELLKFPSLPLYLSLAILSDKGYRG